MPLVAAAWAASGVCVCVCVWRAWRWARVLWSFTESRRGATEEEMSNFKAINTLGNGVSASHSVGLIQPYVACHQLQSITAVTTTWIKDGSRACVCVCVCVCVCALSPAMSGTHRNRVAYRVLCRFWSGIVEWRLCVCVCLFLCSVGVVSRACVCTSVNMLNAKFKCSLRMCGNVKANVCVRPMYV